MRRSHAGHQQSSQWRGYRRTGWRLQYPPELGKGIDVDTASNDNHRVAPVRECVFAYRGGRDADLPGRGKTVPIGVTGGCGRAEIAIHGDPNGRGRGRCRRHAAVAAAAGG